MSNIKNPQSTPLKSSAPVRPPGGDTVPKKIYVCTPFRPTTVSEADREAEQRSNIERALKACRILAMMGIQPLAPHLYFTRFLKDELAAEWCCTIKVDIGNSKGQYEKDKQEVTKDGSESTKIQHRI